MKNFIDVKDVKKTYTMGDITIHALNGVTFSIPKGSFTIIAGASGAGKSTMLNLLGGMDQLTEGSFYVDGEEVSQINDKKMTTYRRNDVGFVFQFYNLVPNLTALENVELATEIKKNSLNPQEVLTQVGLSERLHNFPAQLSGGEQQRVAIARALAKNPKLLLCDEPTGALDYQTGKTILKLLQDMSIERGMTVIVVTHNLSIAPMGNQIIRMKNGQIESITTNDNPTPIERIDW